MERKDIKTFQDTVWDYYKKYGRDLPWRNTSDPYHILVSEVMLQQTQVSRVCEVYPQFIQTFPTIHTLAQASLPDVLAVWQGMGYNRRAKFLHNTAGVISRKYGGVVPNTYEELIGLPGIGPSTAGGVLAFAFNKPIIFIETNIRRVYIHHFFSDTTAVSDTKIREVIEQTMNAKNPREWYYALFDYGSFLGQTQKQNPNTRSKHYTKQSAFQGSRRQLRGMILKTLLAQKRQTKKDLLQLTEAKRQEEIPSILEDLQREGFIMYQRGKYTLTQ